MTPTVPPSRSAGARTALRSPAITAASGRCTIAADPDQVEAAFARDREVVDVEDREVGPAGLEQLRCVGGGRRLADLELDPLALELAARERRVDPGVDGVRLEVEDEGRLVRGARFSTAVAAGDERECGEDGRQRRGDSRHRRGG